MQKVTHVTTEAFDGHVSEVADELGISNKRLYQLLDQNNVYARLWRLLNPLGRVAPERLELIRADFNARVDRLTRGRTEPSTVASVHKETSEAVQAIVSEASREDRRREITEAIAELQKQLNQIDRTSAAGGRTVERFTGGRYA
ncbi:MAG: hypothetical protein R2682_01880 [Pyrinomonadaceae bacterium]